MTEVDELRAEIDILTGRLNACQGTIEMITDSLGSLLEVSGIMSRDDLARLILFNAHARRVRRDGSDAELALVEAAGRRLLRPSDAIVAVDSEGHC